MARDLYAIFAEQLASLALQPGQQIVAALGGGADSQSVLDLLLRYRQQHPQYRYLAIHLDHRFHPDSGIWAAQLKQQVTAQAIDYYDELLTVDVGARQSKEAVGRERRYQRLAELTTNDAVILLGQHRNDQIETLLLQLKRGSGPKGLASMAAVSPFIDKRRLVRPLLSVSKAEIYAYAEQRSLFWIEDDTNYDTSIERNFLRHQVVPLLEQRWPSFGDAVLRSTRLCAEQQDVLETLLAQQLQPLLAGRLRLSWQALLEQPEALQRSLLRHWIGAASAALPSYAQLEQIRKQGLQASAEQQLCVHWQGWQCRRFRQWLYLQPQRPDLRATKQALTWSAGSSQLLIPGWGKVVASQPLAVDCWLGFAAPAARFSMANRQGSKTQSDWLKQSGVPSWQRANWPSLYASQAAAEQASEARSEADSSEHFLGLADVGLSRLGQQRLGSLTLTFLIDGEAED
ncbi:tRNA lysidine(34) synthetase TilS [Idiomarina xiamenensis]|uniref:tRNA(Ile)-lysidine synthase n=1 Tax=Idiomarina xiamenensis 10-D-4 TaxID=740709 RepID=K2JLA0_9GAMM|nr:tRNA lysidine(34) synthetase TilS [Idiomarina xiamenensis]EKE84231.1 PP family ATPase [Idiomarina xiamenensis 10-D-4]